MKTLIFPIALISAFFLFPRVSLAFPIIGDYALFDGVAQTDLGQVNYESSMEVTAIGPEAGMITITSKYIIGGQEQSIDTAAHAETYLELNATVDHCSEAGGILETITVPAGTFDTCHMSNTSSNAQIDFWFGKVPFALVKSVYTRGNVGETKVLKSFVSN